MGVPSPPYRLVLPDLTGWRYRNDGLYYNDTDELSPVIEPGPPRTQQDLQDAGGVPVESPPSEEIDQLLDVLRAAKRRRAASIRSGWLDAWNDLTRDYAHLGGLNRLFIGRPGCWEVEALRHLGNNYNDRHRVDPAAEEALRVAVVRWVTGSYLAHPEELYHVCIGAWEQS